MVPSWNIVQGNSNACMIVSATHLLLINGLPALPWRDVQRLTNPGRGMATYDELIAKLGAFAQHPHEIASTTRGAPKQYVPRNAFGWISDVPLTALEGAEARARAKQLLVRGVPFCYSRGGHAYCTYGRHADPSKVCALNSCGGLSGTGLSRRRPVSVFKKSTLLSCAERDGIMYVEPKPLSTTADALVGLKACTACPVVAASDHSS